MPKAAPPLMQTHYVHTWQRCNVALPAQSFAHAYRLGNAKLKRIEKGIWHFCLPGNPPVLGWVVNVAEWLGEEPSNLSALGWLYLPKNDTPKGCMGIFLQGEAKQADIAESKLEKPSNGYFLKPNKHWPARAVQTVVLYRLAKLHVLDMVFFLEQLQCLALPDPKTVASKMRSS